MKQPVPSGDYTSAFDALRRVGDDDVEYWSARDLMPSLGYTKWEYFADAIQRAMEVCGNSLIDIPSNFPEVRKVAASGPAAKDYHLTRLAAYHVALCADTRKPAVAAAITYFVYRTREAELASERPAIPATYAEALRAAADEADRADREAKARIEAETRAKELEAPAASWETLANSAGDYEVADAAKVLSRDPNIFIGRDRLFSFMAGQGWVFRNNFNGRWKAYQTQVDAGRLVEKLSKPFQDHHGAWKTHDPIIRITPKGLHELHKRLGGQGKPKSLTSRDAT